jgi:hypothetical protein
MYGTWGHSFAVNRPADSLRHGALEGPITGYPLKAPFAPSRTASSVSTPERRMTQVPSAIVFKARRDDRQRRGAL